MTRLEEQTGVLHTNQKEDDDTWETDSVFFTQTRRNMSYRTCSSHNVPPLQQFLVCMQFGCKSISHRECKSNTKSIVYGRGEEMKRKRWGREGTHIRRRRRRPSSSGDNNSSRQEWWVLVSPWPEEEGERVKGTFMNPLWTAMKQKNTIIWEAKTLPSQGFIWPWEIDNG